MSNSFSRFSPVIILFCSVILHTNSFALELNKPSVLEGVIAGAAGGVEGAATWAAGKSLDCHIGGNCSDPIFNNGGFKSSAVGSPSDQKNIISKKFCKVSDYSAPGKNYEQTLSEFYNKCMYPK